MFEKEFAEVNQVIKHMEPEDVKQIPKDFLKIIEDNMDSSYNFDYDESKNLNEQNLSEDSKLIISVIYLKYLAPDEEKRILYEKLLEDKKRNEKRVLSHDELFKNNKTNNQQFEEKSSLEVSVIEKKEKWYLRIFEKLKGIFNFFKN